MLSILEIQKILETINEHTENEKINERFKDILTELNKSTLPRCKNDTTRYLSIEEINTEVSNSQDITTLASRLCIK